MLASLCWVPRGAGKTKFPEGVDATADTNDNLVDSPDASKTADDQTSNGDLEMDDAKTEDQPSTLDVADILSGQLDKLAFYKPGQKDPYLTTEPEAAGLFDEEELNDLTVGESDSLVVTVTCSDDASSLEVHLFDDNPEDSDDDDAPYTPHSYVHHDIILPSLPLCVAYTSLTTTEAKLNLVAVGMFTPGIDVWDIDRLNNLEPLQSLGGYQSSSYLEKAIHSAAQGPSTSKQKARANSSPDTVEGSHTDAVMCLSWNNVQKEYLASGSADTTVKVWDIESAHCACTLSHHQGKVQSVSFHPEKESILLTGSFDKTIRMIDVRDPGKTSSWSISADVETCNWGCGPTRDLVVCTTEDGYASVFDARGTNSKNPLARWNVHRGPASACSVSADIPGLMVTGGVDKSLRVWDISSVSEGISGQLIYERNVRAGAIFSASLCPLPALESNASPFVVAFGGAKGSLHITDLAVESEAVRNHFLSKCPAQGRDVIQRRFMRGLKPTGVGATAAEYRGTDYHSDKHDEASPSSGSEASD